MDLFGREYEYRDKRKRDTIFKIVSRFLLSVTETYASALSAGITDT